MDVRAVEALVGYFRKFIQDFLGTRPSLACSEFPSLTEPEQEKFDEVVRKWKRRSEFKEAISEIGLRRRLERAVVEALNAPAASDSIAQQLINALQQEMICDVVLPLNGIDLSNVSFRLADDIRAVQMTTEAFNEIVVAGYRHAASESPEAQARAAQIAENLKPSLLNRAALVIRATGDEVAAEWAAHGRADLAVDALQYMVSLVAHPHWRYMIDWRGNVPVQAWRRAAIIPVAGDILSTNPGERTGSLAAWRPLPQEFDQLHKDERIFDLIQLPMKRELSLHEDRLVRAIRSFAYGDRQPTVDGKKLAYITVFDIFFALPGTKTTESVREGVAFTMVPITERTEADQQRLETAEFINGVYDSRSDTTHEFRVGVFEPADLERLRVIALNFIYVMWRRHKFDGKDEIQQWLGAQRTQLGERYSPYEKFSRKKSDDKSATKGDEPVP